MGCNIHIHAELREGDKWHHYGHYCPEVWYAAFYHIGGVRGPVEGITPIAPKRGVPDDVTFVTQMSLIEDCSSHSHTWMSSREVEALGKWMPGGDHLSLWLAGQTEIPTATADLFGYPWRRESACYVGFDDFRWVIWFDN